MSLYRDCCCTFCDVTAITLDTRFSQVYSFVCNTSGTSYTLYPNGSGTSRNINVPNTDTILRRLPNPVYPSVPDSYPYYWQTANNEEPWTGYSVANCAGNCSWLAYHGARISMYQHDGSVAGYWAAVLTMWHRWQRPGSGPCQGGNSFYIYATQHLFVDYGLCPIGTWTNDPWTKVDKTVVNVETGIANITGGSFGGAPIGTFGAKSGFAVTT